MKTLIEIYRGWEIFFDKDKEQFYTHSNEFDNDSYKKSYSQTKKYIDDYLKENDKFIPFKAMSMNGMYNSAKEITIIGKRKDGAYMYEDSDGNKRQLSKYDEDSYFLPNDLNEPIFLEIEKIESEINTLRNVLGNKRAEVIKKTVSQVREELKN